MPDMEIPGALAGATGDDGCLAERQPPSNSVASLAAQPPSLRPTPARRPRKAKNNPALIRTATLLFAPWKA